jgi:ABC-type nitrate/sulfonate/bicarbonate transport system permease component
MLGAQRGLGYLIMLYSQSYNTARTFAVIVIVLVLVGSLYGLVNKVLKEDAVLSLG